MQGWHKHTNPLVLFFHLDIEVLHFLLYRIIRIIVIHQIEWCRLFFCNTIFPAPVPLGWHFHKEQDPVPSNLQIPLLLWQAIPTQDSIIAIFFSIRPPLSVFWLFILFSICFCYFSSHISFDVTKDNFIGILPSHVSLGAWYHSEKMHSVLSPHIH